MRGLFHIVNRIFIDIFFIKNQFVTLYFQSHSFILEGDFSFPAVSKTGQKTVV